jgi:hypothetical protein
MFSVSHCNGPRAIATSHGMLWWINSPLQVIPSSTAPTATIRMASVAVIVVTAVASHRNSRRRPRLECAARGIAVGIAGRISTGMDSLPSADYVGDCHYTLASRHIQSLVSVLPIFCLNWLADVSNRSQAEHPVQCHHKGGVRVGRSRPPPPPPTTLDVATCWPPSTTFEVLLALAHVVAVSKTTTTAKDFTAGDFMVRVLISVPAHDVGGLPWRL